VLHVSDPTFEVIATAWARLIRANTRALGAIEGDIKRAGFPPLAWYDVLLELKRQPSGGLRPRDLEQHLLLEQHNVSRLIDRMEKQGLVKRQPHEEDGRAQLIAITPSGRELQRKIWPTYRAAIQRHIGDRLTAKEAEKLSELLAKLM
jgi:DNA-binding MarR family transcriptional regulator